MYKQAQNQNSQKDYQKEKMQESSEEDAMIMQELNNLAAQRQEQIKRSELVQKNSQIWTDANYQPAKGTTLNRHNFNIYADKLLTHLVIEEEFNFVKISQIMTYTFKYEHKLYSDQMCRERWYEMHRDREIHPLIKGKQASKPKDKQQNTKKGQQSADVSEKMGNHSKTQNNESHYTNHGYNIFKDSIRKIDDVQKYNELQKQMKYALQKASQSIQLEKPMLYTPYYDRLQQFQVLQEELTVQKMQQLMSHPIEMQLMERQLKALDLNERHFESQVKKYVEKKVKQQKIRNQEEFEIQQNWDEYESD